MQLPGEYLDLDEANHVVDREQTILNGIINAELLLSKMRWSVA